MCTRTKKKTSPFITLYVKIMSVLKTQWKLDFLTYMMHSIKHHIPKITFYLCKKSHGLHEEFLQKDFIKQQCTAWSVPLCKVPKYVYKYLIQLKTFQMLPMLISFSAPHLLCKAHFAKNQELFINIHLGYYSCISTSRTRNDVSLIGKRDFPYCKFYILYVCASELFIGVYDICNTPPSLHLPWHYSHLYIRKHQSNTRV